MKKVENDVEHFFKTLDEGFVAVWPPWTEVEKGEVLEGGRGHEA